MVAPLFMIVRNIIVEMLIQYLIDPLGLPIDLQMKNNIKF